MQSEGGELHFKGSVPMLMAMMAMNFIVILPRKTNRASGRGCEGLAIFKTKTVFKLVLAQEWKTSEAFLIFSPPPHSRFSSDRQRPERWGACINYVTLIEISLGREESSELPESSLARKALEPLS